VSQGQVGELNADEVRRFYARARCLAPLLGPGWVISLLSSGIMRVDRSGEPRYRWALRSVSTDRLLG